MNDRRSAVYRLSLLTALAVPAASPAAEVEGAPSAANAALFDRLDADHSEKLTTGEVPVKHERLFARLLRRADRDGNNSLSRDEFIAGLVPSRPEKPLEAKQPATLPQADAVRWLLLTIDVSGNSSIEEEEVPDQLSRVFEAMVARLDANKDDVIERRELFQGGPALARIAGRYVQSEGIDTAAALKKLEQKFGSAARRFEAPPARLENLADPKQAREMFRQLDGNGNGRIETAEVPQPFERGFERLVRLADRDEDGQLSRGEFLGATQQMARRQARQAAREMPAVEGPPAAQSMPADEQ